MENLKFRAWHKKHEMYYDLLKIDWLDGFVLIDNEYDCSTADLDEVVIEQYTGLKDKNGKEIYVGDILMEIEYKEKGVVALNNGSYSVDWGYGFKLMSESVRYNVVGGNVHEHGDFL